MPYIQFMYHIYRLLWRPVQPSRRAQASEFQGKVLAHLAMTSFPLTPQVEMLKVSGAFQIVEQRETLPIF